jgi:predicted dehydrogenase
MREKHETRLAVPSRRGFLAGTAAGVAAAPFLRGTRPARAAGLSQTQEIRVGLVGCGGRGTGAATEALRADKNVRVVALGDAFADRLDSSLAALLRDEAAAGRVDVPKERRFVGFDAYKGVIDAGVDVVLLASPPHFRPLHLSAAVAAGKHAFAEKPVAVDAAGVRKVLEACALARQKRLSVASGFCFRYHRGFQEALRRVHAGAIGEVRALLAHDFRGPIWVKPRQPGWSDMEWQMRNWYYFTWLSGDFNVEQHVHFLDICAWVMKGQYPVRASGTGGRQQRTAPEYGYIYDHHAVVYEFSNGAKLFSTCRQMAGAYNTSSIQVLGTKGEAVLADKKVTINTRRPWTFDADVDKFQAEQDALFSSIRRGRPIDDGDFMAKSTLMAIMGRTASYTGQLVTWEEALDSQEDLSPPKYEWGSLRTPAVAVPGSTRT